MSEEDGHQASTQSPTPGTSPTTSTSSPFLGDTGPGFDPNRQPAPDRLQETAIAGTVLPVEITEDKVRSLLKNGGDLAHATIGVGQLDWVMTATDQDRIAPPLTRIVNQHERVAGVLQRSDYIAVVIGSGLYTWRSLIERETVLRVEREREKAIRAAGGQPQPQATVAPPPPPPREPAVDAAEPSQFNGVSVAQGYVPEAMRRFGRGGPNGA